MARLVIHMDCKGGRELQFLEPGDVFLYKGEHWMKTDREDANIFCVRLCDGSGEHLYRYNNVFDVAMLLRPLEVEEDDE